MKKRTIFLNRQRNCLNGQKRRCNVNCKKYLELVKKSNFPMQMDKAYLFGSYVKGCSKKDSDIEPFPKLG
jgi:hypothetical protein